MLATLVLVVFAAGPVDNANPVYRALRESGLPLGGKVSTKLPAPTMPDGASAREQKEILEKLAGADYSLDELLRDSVVAPFVLRFREVSPSPPDAKAHGLDFWFVAYGDLARVADKDLLQPFLNAGRKDTQVTILGAEALAKRGIKFSAPAGDQEMIAYASFPLIDRVRLSMTSHTYLTRGADSVLFAGVCDPRFAADKEYPNQWRPIIKDEDGQTRLGPPSAYEGFGYYVKVTRLAKPAGALFVEHHLVFTEPRKWFNGANLLRSKLPLVIQSDVRSFRRELRKIKPAK